MTYQVQIENELTSGDVRDDIEFNRVRVQLAGLGAMLFRAPQADGTKVYFAVVNTTCKYLPSMEAVEQLLVTLAVTETQFGYRSAGTQPEHLSPIK